MHIIDKTVNLKLRIAISKFRQISLLISIDRALDHVISLFGHISIVSAHNADAILVLIASKLKVTYPTPSWS